MTWAIEQILNFPEEKPWGQGYAHYGFHDSLGNRYFFDYFHHWVGRLGRDDEFLWTAGVRPDATTGLHMDAKRAALGSDPSERFDGPYGLCVDEYGNLFIADTCNHVVRTVDASTNVISTIAGRCAVIAHQRNDRRETDPLNLNLPKLSALDYYDGRLFIPEWDGDLIVMKRTQRLPGDTTFSSGPR